MAGLYYPGCEVQDWMDYEADMYEMQMEEEAPSEEEIEEMYYLYRLALEKEDSFERVGLEVRAV